MRARTMRLPNSVTGPTGQPTNPSEGPVTVTLHEGGSKTTATISTCRASGLAKLTCKQ
jgi:hypothetical protein